jgi:hypothetical protein
MLFLILGGLLYNAYSKLKPEAFTQLIRDQIQRNYPGAELSLDKISYSFSLDFKFNLENIHLRRNNKLLARMGVLELRIHWWLFIVNQGNAQVNIQDLDVYVDHEVDQVSSTDRLKKENEMVRVSLPSYLVDARYTLRINNASIKDIKSGRRYFVVSKLLVREFQHGKNSAFELNIPISINRHKQNYTSELWLFGDVTPGQKLWTFNYRGEFRTRDNAEVFHFDDLVLDGKASLNPSSFNVKSDIQLSIEKSPVAKGALEISQDSLEFNLGITQLPLNYVGLIYEDIKTPYLLKPDGFAKGTFKFKKRLDSTAHFSGKILFDGDFHFSEKDTIAGVWQIGLQDNRLEISFMSPKGEASFFRRSVIDPETATVSQYIEELGFSGLDLRLSASAIPSVEQILKDSKRPFYSSTVSLKKCLLGDFLFDGQFRFGHTPDQSFYEGDLRSEKSSFALKFLRSGAGNSLELEFKKFNWNPFFLFLVPYFTAEAGELDGSVQGQWLEDWYEGKWAIKMKARELVEMKGFYNSLLEKAASYFELDIKNLKNHQLNLSSKNNVFDISALVLDSVQTNKISGTLSTSQKSFLNLSQPKMKVVRKAVTEPFWISRE